MDGWMDEWKISKKEDGLKSDSKKTLYGCEVEEMPR